MFGHEGPCTWNLAADGCTLQDAHQHEKDGGEDADRRIGRHDSHAERRQRHQEDRKGKDLFAAEHVAEMGEHDAAERANEITGCENTEGLDQYQPFRHVRRKEQFADHRREKDEDDEIIEFQGAAEGREAEGSEILRGKTARCGSRRSR
ncbi:hypothetical protein D3C73_564280 [compost metagenome]